MNQRTGQNKTATEFHIKTIKHSNIGPLNLQPKLANHSMWLSERSHVLPRHVLSYQRILVLSQCQNCLVLPNHIHTQNIACGPWWVRWTTHLGHQCKWLLVLQWESTLMDNLKWFFLSKANQIIIIIIDFDNSLVQNRYVFQVSWRSDSSLLSYHLQHSQSNTQRHNVTTIKFC